MESPYTVAAAVLAHVEDALTAAGRPVGVSMVAAGGLVIDDCCVGLLIVAPERVYRTGEVFPAEADTDEICGDWPIAIDLVVRVDRCVPTFDKRGHPPTAEAQEAAARAILLDAAIVWRAVTSVGLLGDDGAGFPVWERANVGQTFAGPQGGCVAVETRLTLGVGSAGWCIP